jgi:hypothetical protein
MDRALEPESSCIDLVLSLGFIIGEKLRPAGGTVPTPPPPPSAAVTAAPAASAPTSAPVRTNAPALIADSPSPDDDSFGDSDRMRGRVSFGAAFGVGSLPAPGLGPVASLGFQWRRFGMALEGRVLVTPNFAIDDHHSAWAMLPLGGFSLSLQMARLPAPLYTLEFVPFIAAGRLIVSIANNENQPNYFASDAHPFQLITGMRFPVLWRISKKPPDWYLKTFIEGDIGLLRNHISFNNVTVWAPFPQFGLTLGVEGSFIVNQPRKWDKPDPDPPPITEAQTARGERRYW